MEVGAESGAAVVVVVETAGGAELGVAVVGATTGEGDEGAVKADDLPKIALGVSFGFAR